MSHPGKGRFGCFGGWENKIPWVTLKTVPVYRTIVGPLKGNIMEIFGNPPKLPETLTNEIVFALHGNWEGIAAGKEWEQIARFAHQANPIPRTFVLFPAPSPI